MRDRRSLTPGPLPDERARLSGSISSIDSRSVSPIPGAQPSTEHLQPWKPSVHARFSFDDTPTQYAPIRRDTVPINNYPPAIPGEKRHLGLPVRRGLRERLIPSGWWWELGAVLLTLLCVALTAAVLITMDGRPLRKWTLAIQPNSVVSVLSTVIKTCLLYPLSECLGQLKWSYFERPRPLSKMHAFDNASRGPWGATVFLWETRITPILAWLGALVMILMLAFEPFAQQVLDFKTRSVASFNVTAQVAATNNWPANDLGPDNSIVTQRINFPMASAIYGALSEPDVKAVNTYCPTQDCTYQPFESLGVCSSCSTTPVDSLKLSCTYELIYNDGDNYLHPRNFSTMVSLRKEVLRNGTGGFSLKSLCWFDRFVIKTDSMLNDAGQPYKSYLSVIQPNEVDSNFVSLDAISQYVESTALGGRGVQVGGSYFPNKKLTYCTTQSLEYWRQHAGNTQMNETHATQLTNTTCFTSTMDLEHVGDISQLGALNGSITECFLNLCGKRYDGIETRNDRTSVQQIEEYGLTYTNASEVNLTMQMQYTYQFPDAVAISNSSSKSRYSWNVTSTGDLGLLVQDIFNARQFTQYMHMPIADSPSIFAGNVSLAWSRIATAASRIIQSSANPSTQNLTGVAMDFEVYVRVRWEWFMMPLTLIVMSIIFLLLTVVESSSKSYLFKNNILAVLFHGLDGWDTRTATYSDGHGRQRGSTIVATSREMMTVLKENDSGSLKLKRD